MKRALKTTLYLILLLAVFGLFSLKPIVFAVVIGICGLVILWLAIYEITEP